MTGRRSHGRLSALNGVVHQGNFTDVRGSGSFDFSIFYPVFNGHLSNPTCYGTKSVSESAAQLFLDNRRPTPGRARVMSPRGTSPPAVLLFVFARHESFVLAAATADER